MCYQDPYNMDPLASQDSKTPSPSSSSSVPRRSPRQASTTASSPPLSSPLEMVQALEIMRHEGPMTDASAAQLDLIQAQAIEATRRRTREAPAPLRVQYALFVENLRWQRSVVGLEDELEERAAEAAAAADRLARLEAQVLAAELQRRGDEDRKFGGFGLETATYPVECVARL